MIKTTSEQGLAPLPTPAAESRIPAAVAQQAVYIVLPAYNEQDALAPLLAAVRETMDPSGMPYTVIVVDDGSRDATALIANKASLDMPVDLVEHETNRGLAAALSTGLGEALAQCGSNDVIITMDADNTHPPRLIPQMVDALNAGHDVVIASRFQPGAKVHGVPWSRGLFSLGARWMFQVLFPIRGVRDYTCGYRAYRADALWRATETYGHQLVTETGFSCMADVLLKLRPLNLRMTEVPLELHYDRRGGGSKMPVLRTIRQTLLLLVRRRLGMK